LHRIAEDGQFPWELKIPNAETQTAMEEARAAINKQAAADGQEALAIDRKKAACK
jgi:antitoxin component of RelBE/YafQ-DinJ toxin-antitoxin module